MIKLSGNCNRCGNCCVDDNLRCVNLKIHGPLGTPGATTCRVYRERFIGMPILLVNDENDTIEGIGSCTYGDEVAENKEIITKGIGKGCSLTLLEA